MAYTRRKVSSKVKKNTVHTIDGIKYKSKTLVEYHKELFQAVENRIIKSFTLPHAGDKHSYSKYGASKAEVDGIIFDSVMEARFYVYLKTLQKNKQIKGFDIQVKYVLQDKYRNKFTGKAVLPITYIADFSIITLSGDEVVVDVKGRETADFKIKKKMFGYKYPDKYFMCVQWRASTQSWEDLEDIKKSRREKKKKAAED